MKIKFEIDNGSLSKAIQNIQLYGRKKQEDIVKTINKSAVNIDKNAKLNLTENDSINTGALRAAMAVNPAITSKPVAEVFNNLKYAAFVEYGRRSGKMPPIDAIEYWVRRKLGITAKESRQVAFQIARAIARNGTKPKPFFVPAFNDEKANFVRNMKTILRK